MIPCNNREVPPFILSKPCLIWLSLLSINTAYSSKYSHSKKRKRQFANDIVHEFLSSQVLRSFHFLKMKYSWGDGAWDGFPASRTITDVDSALIVTCTQNMLTKLLVSDIELVLQIRQIPNKKWIYGKQGDWCFSVLWLEISLWIDWILLLSPISLIIYHFLVVL